MAFLLISALRIFLPFPHSPLSSNVIKNVHYSRQHLGPWCSRNLLERVTARNSAVFSYVIGVKNKAENTVKVKGGRVRLKT